VEVLSKSAWMALADFDVDVGYRQPITVKLQGLANPWRFAE
jgi:hypothetical protein